MKKNVLVCFLALLFITTAYSQKINNKTAQVIVSMKNAKGEPLKNEQVVFTAKGVKIITATTHKNGLDTVTLPAGAEYNVKIKAFADSTNYGTLPIAALSEGEFYTDPFKIDIEYEPARSFVLNNIEFDFGKATLRPTSNKELKELFEYMKWKDENKIEIGGHTDNVGTDAANIALSKARAEAVKKWLVTKGIAATRIVTKGYGAQQPVADNSTDEGRQKNRRIEVGIIE